MRHLRSLAGLLRPPRVWGGCLVAAVAAAVLLRAVYWHQFTSLPVGRVAVGADVAEYDAWAREILVRGPLWDRLHIHAPLYPLFLAAVYWCGGASIPAARAVQLGLDVASLVLVSLALVRLVGRRCGFFAAGLWALYQPLIYYSAELFSEGLAVFLLSAAFCCWACAHGPGGRGRVRVWPLAASAWFCGLAAVAHPLTLFLGLPQAAWCARTVVRRGGTTSWRHPAMVLAAFALPILPVTWRNAWVSGEFVLIQANDGLNLYIGNNPDATGTCYLRPGAAYDAVVNQPAAAGIHTAAGARRYFVGRAARFARTQPVTAARLLGRKALLTWNAADLPSGPDLPEMQVLTPFMRTPLMRFGVVAPLALVGLLWWRRRRLAPVAGALVLGTATLAVFVTSGRYRLPMAPMLLAAAALGLEIVCRAWRRDATRTCGAAAGLAMAGLAAALLPQPPPLPTSGAETTLLLAEAAWKSGDAETAARLLATGLEQTPDNPAMLHLMGTALTAQGYPLAAIAALKAALSLDPARVGAAVDLATALAAGGEPEAALHLLTQAAANHPSHAGVAYNLGVLHAGRGETDQAAAAYQRAIQLEPTHASAHLNLGVLLHGRGRADEALGHYRAALRLRPRDDKALAGIAVYHAQRGETAAALRHFDRAIRANPRRQDLIEARDELRQASARPRTPARKSPNYP